MKPVTEDLNTGELGEFQNCQTLLISEVRVLLQLSKTTTPLQEKTKVYCQRFSRFNSKTSVKQTRVLLEHLHPFEMTLVGNLCPESAEEALVLVPTLQRIPEHLLEALVQDLNLLKNLA